MEEIMIGIDPGLDGAFAFVPVRGDRPWVYDTPTISIQGATRQHRHCEPAEITAILKSAMADYRLRATIEGVHAMPRQGVSSMFSLGEGYGMWLGILAALGIPYSIVSARDWKRAYGLDSDKGRSRAEALRRWPTLADQLNRKRDHGRAEALLIARYRIGA